MADKNYSEFTTSANRSEIAYLVGYLNTAANGERKITIDDFLLAINRVDSKIFTQPSMNTLTDAASIVWDFDDGDLSQVTLTADRVFAAPSNIKIGVKTLRVIQDGTGGHVPTWNAAFKWVSGVEPTINTGANEETFISFFTDGTNVIGIGATEAFLTEALLKEVSRQYTSGQGGTIVDLDIVSSETDIDFEDGNFFALTLDAATELQAPLNDQPFSCVIYAEQDGTGSRALTFHSAYVVKGDAVPSGANNEFDINIQSDGAGRLTAVILDRQ